MGIISQFDDDLTNRWFFSDTRPLVPVNSGGLVEPMTRLGDFDRINSLLNDENFLGTLIPEGISIGLKNIRFDKKSKFFQINVNALVDFPRDPKSLETKTVDIIIRLDNLQDPTNKKPLFRKIVDVNKFRASISAVLKQWYPSVDSGLNAADRKSLIDDIQRRSLATLCNQIVMPRLKEHLRERQAQDRDRLERIFLSSPSTVGQAPPPPSDLYEIMIRQINILNRLSQADPESN